MMKKLLIPFLILSVVSLTFPGLVSAQATATNPNGPNGLPRVAKNPDGSCPTGYQADGSGCISIGANRGLNASSIEKAKAKPPGACGYLDLACALFDKLLIIPSLAAFGILKIVTGLTYLAGGILNWVVQYTVVNMKANIDSESISNAWRVIRDVGNMGFIFILLYAAIQTILGKAKENQRLITNIVIAAVLMNFSLFFTKVVIDAANVIALTFYDKIAPGSLTAPKDLWAHGGIANSLMQPLGIQSIWNASNWSGENMLLISTLAIIFCLIASFVMVAISILFIMRFVVLLLLMALSPVLFLGMVLPGTKKYSNQWWDALVGQASFAPVYFIMTWVVLVLLKGFLPSTDGQSLLGAAQGAGQLSSVGIIVNFFIIIGFLIASLVVSKQLAEKTGYGFNSLTKWATSAAGGATFGMMGRLGRNTIGAGASRLAQSEKFQNYASKNVVGQFALNQTNKTARSSFDLRATRAGASIPEVDTGKAQTGGYEAVLDKKIDKREKFANTLRSNASKENFATRIASGPLTRGGSRSTVNTVFGTLGRQNRVVASKILSNRVNTLRTDLNNGNTELTRYQNIINQYIAANPGHVPPLTPATAAPLALNTTQSARYTTLSAPAGTAGSLADIQANITNLQNQINTLGLNNPSNTTLGRPIRADEQKF